MWNDILRVKVSIKYFIDANIASKGKKCTIYSDVSKNKL